MNDFYNNGETTPICYLDGYKLPNWMESVDVEPINLMRIVRGSPLTNLIGAANIGPLLFRGIL